MLKKWRQRQRMKDSNIVETTASALRLVREQINILNAGLKELENNREKQEVIIDALVESIRRRDKE